MKKKVLFLLGSMVFAAALLCGCQQEDASQSSESTPVSGSTSKVSDSETYTTEKPAAFQFVKGHGIVSSDHPVYVLDADTVSDQIQDNVTLTLVDVVLQDRTLIANLLVTEHSDYETSDESDISLKKYREDMWADGEGIKLTGPTISGEGCKPAQSQYISYPDFYEAYGYMRSFIAATFELPAAPVPQTPASKYAFQVLDFEKPVEFSLKQAPGYDSLDALAAAEGNMDTNDGLSILAVGKAVEEGILVDWYRYSESTTVNVSLSHTPPMQKGHAPLLFSGEREYPAKRSLRYADKLNLYRPEGLVGAQAFQQLFIVPVEERNAVFSLKVPGVTYLSNEESEPITIPIPEDFKELTEEIPFLEGSVRLRKITSMTEPQEYEKTDSLGNTTTSERPAVYLDVSAAEDGRSQSLRSLICQRKAGKHPGERGWENQRYDFNDEGNLSGFRIFYDEGDTEIVLKFSGPGFYREQNFEIELDILKK